MHRSLNSNRLALYHLYCCYQLSLTLFAMLAMCVRKTADTGGTPTSMQAPVPFASSTTTTTKRKLKGLRSRGSGSTKKQSESTTTGMAGTSGSSSSLKKHHQYHQPAAEKTSSCSTVDVDCTVKVRDDPEGHLIYRKGDVVDSRCKLMAVSRG